MVNQSILGLYRDNGKEHGNYYCILALYRIMGLGFRLTGVLCLHITPGILQQL